MRALTEYLTVLGDYDRARGADDLYMVISESGEEYLVDARMGTCECPDYEYRTPDGGCKHVRRVTFATGERPMPAWVNADAVDEQLGMHVDGPTHVACTDARPRAVADGGVAVETEETAVDGDSGSDDERPDDCQCMPVLADEGLPCWPCFREGFETPAAVESTDE